VPQRATPPEKDTPSAKTTRRHRRQFGTIRKLPSGRYQAR
jgi:hypothetical protein